MHAASQPPQTGLYLSSYFNDAGVEVFLVTTQFEATFARRAFPCFDEPAYKAVFNVTIDGVPTGYTALGNMPVTSTTPNGDGTSRISFQPSPKARSSPMPALPPQPPRDHCLLRSTYSPAPQMSTYLVAAVAAPLISVSGISGQNNVAVSVYAVARADNYNKIAYALDAGMRVLTYYEGTLGVPYPLPKLDMIAIPDFAAGGAWPSRMRVPATAVPVRMPSPTARSHGELGPHHLP